MTPGVNKSSWNIIAVSGAVCERYWNRSAAGFAVRTSLQFVRFGWLLNHSKSPLSHSY
jgi:hypothetical protein